MLFARFEPRDGPREYRVGSPRESRVRSDKLLIAWKNILKLIKNTWLKISLIVVSDLVFGANLSQYRSLH